jgi:hypothetical protein
MMNLTDIKQQEVADFFYRHTWIKALNNFCEPASSGRHSGCHCTPMAKLASRTSNPSTNPSGANAVATNLSPILEMP